MITYEEFMKLSDEEKRIRYTELSNHDAFRVRISEPIIGETVGYAEVSEEEQEKARKQILEFIKENNL